MLNKNNSALKKARLASIIWSVVMFFNIFLSFTPYVITPGFMMRGYLHSLAENSGNYPAYKGLLDGGLWLLIYSIAFLVVIGLAYGVYKRNKLCIILLFAYVIIYFLAAIYGLYFSGILKPGYLDWAMKFATDKDVIYREYLKGIVVNIIYFSIIIFVLFLLIKGIRSPKIE